MKILITGGAGYKGVKLAESLLGAGHKVCIFDNFIYGYEPVFRIVTNKNLEITKKDIRNIQKSEVAKFDIIYHLAALSSYPACEANPHAAQVINVDATKKLIKLLAPSQVLVYASTTSLYGDIGKNVDEKTKPKPVSLYAVTKYQAEQAVMKRKNSISYRFATLFGISPRMRNDLMVNDFVFRAISERSLVLFDSKSVRTFLHVDDAIDAYMLATKKTNKMLGGIFNVGSNDLNYSKIDLAKKIKKYVKFEIIDSVLEDKDKRDFFIKYDKINNLGFKHKKTLEQGIKELVKLYSFYLPHSHFRTI